MLFGRMRQRVASTAQVHQRKDQFVRKCIIVKDISLDRQCLDSFKVILDTPMGPGTHMWQAAGAPFQSSRAAYMRDHSTSAASLSLLTTTALQLLYMPCIGTCGTGQ
jgi:hypothetical protein